MPITPLHFGLMAPVNHWSHNKLGLVSFVLINIWLDLTNIMRALANFPLMDHTDTWHTLEGALLSAAAFTLVGILSTAWVLGAYFGALSHILLDALVHREMHPFAPWMKGNPLFMDWMEPLSMALLPLTVWFIFQCVSYSLGWARKLREDARQDFARHTPSEPGSDAPGSAGPSP